MNSYVHEHFLTLLYMTSYSVKEERSLVTPIDCKWKMHRERGHDPEIQLLFRPKVNFVKMNLLEKLFFPWDLKQMNLIWKIA